MLISNRTAALVLLAAPAAAPAAALGQDHPDCQTELTPELAARAWELHVSGAYEVGPRPEGVVYVPLTFHVVRNSQGKWPYLPGMGHDRLQRVLDRANEHFLSTGIQFCRPGPTRYIDDDNYFYWLGGVTAEELFAVDPVPGTVNVYITHGFNRAPCRSSFSFSPLPHGIIVGDWCLTNMTTFSHELGHYFDLFHTFERMFGLECVSGSNCDVAGDLVCDTPADPGGGGGAISNCEWRGILTGPCPGDPVYDPPMRNLMSYRSSSCRDHFTPEQSERMLATILNLRTELDLALCNSPCYSDCDASGALDFFDFLCFQNAFLAGDPYADCDGDGTLSFQDFVCFQNEFLAGCV
jgi:hypothetical protein